MTDPAEDVATAVAEFFADPVREYSQTVVATVPEHVNADLHAEAETFRLVVIPVGEIEEKQARGRVTLAPMVNVVAMAGASTFGSRTAFNALVREIRESLRFVAMSGWSWQKSETITKYDPERLAKQTYLSAFTLTYLGIE